MNRYCWLAVLVIGGGAACKADDPSVPIDRVAIASVIDSIVAKDRSTQLTATALDAAGNSMSVVFTWLSSNPAIAPVGSNGLVEGREVGSATIRAEVPAEPGVHGEYRLRVVAADLGTVQALGNDDYLRALLAALSGTARPSAQTTWTAILGHAGDGNIVGIVRSVGEVRTQGAAASDGNDRALLAVLGLFGNEIERRLAL